MHCAVRTCITHRLKMNLSSYATHWFPEAYRSADAMARVIARTFGDSQPYPSCDGDPYSLSWVYAGACNIQVTAVYLPQVSPGTFTDQPKRRMSSWVGCAPTAGIEPSPLLVVVDAVPPYVILKLPGPARPLHFSPAKSTISFQRSFAW